MSNQDEYGVKFKHDLGYETQFLVERTADGLSWEFVHSPLWAASESDDVDDVAYHGLREAAATLRRWAAELGHVADEMMTPELDEAESQIIE